MKLTGQDIFTLMQEKGINMGNAQAQAELRAIVQPLHLAGCPPGDRLLAATPVAVALRRIWEVAAPRQWAGKTTSSSGPLCKLRDRLQVEA